MNPVTIVLGLAFAAGLFIVFRSFDLRGAVGDDHLEQRRHR